MSNWICSECGANYIDVSHQEPSVLREELEIRKLKGLLKECLPYVNFFLNMKTEWGLTPPEPMDLRDKINKIIGEK